MSIFKEFKEFAMKGNLVDMAVAFVMGAAFAKLVTSFIDGMVMPLVGKLISNVDFKQLKYILTEAEMDSKGKVITPETAVRYGEFITMLIDFLLIAFVMFILVRGINKLKKKQATTPVEPPPLSLDQRILTEIRDLLKTRQP